MGGVSVFLFVPRGVRDSPAPGESVTEREKLGDEGTVPGAAARPRVLTGIIIMATEQGAPKVLPRGSLARGGERKLTLVLLLRGCLRRKSANTDFCNDS